MIAELTNYLIIQPIIKLPIISVIQSLAVGIIPGVSSNVQRGTEHYGTSLGLEIIPSLRSWSLVYRYGRVELDTKLLVAPEMHHIAVVP